MSDETWQFLQRQIDSWIWNGEAFWSPRCKQGTNEGCVIVKTRDNNGKLLPRDKMIMTLIDNHTRELIRVDKTCRLILY